MKLIMESWTRFINEAEETPYEMGYEDGYDGEKAYYPDNEQYMDGYDDGRQARAKELEG